MAADKALKHALEIEANSRNYTADTAQAPASSPPIGKAAGIGEAEVDLLAGNAISNVTVTGVPNGAVLTAGTDRLSVQNAARVDRLASFYGDEAKAKNALRVTLPERQVMHDFDGVFFDAVDGLDAVVNARGIDASNTRHAGAAQLAGLMMDNVTAERVMQSQTYADPVDPFATDAVRSFYANTYADNDAAAPARKNALEEPERKAKVESMEQSAAQSTQARLDKAYADMARYPRAPSASPRSTSSPTTPSAPL